MTVWKVMCIFDMYVFVIISTISCFSFLLILIVSNLPPVKAALIKASFLLLNNYLKHSLQDANNKILNIACWLSNKTLDIFCKMNIYAYNKRLMSHDLPQILPPSLTWILLRKIIPQELQ